jgi:hypothetical protein
MLSTMFAATFGQAAVLQQASLDAHGDDLVAPGGDPPVTKDPPSHAGAATALTFLARLEGCRRIFHS